MSLVIVENGPQSFSIVDRAVPGGEDLEHQTSRARAEAALSRWQARRGGELRVVTTAGAENVSAAQQRREMLAATLKGKAAEGRRRVERVTSADDLAVLAELEADGLGRQTVLKAIEAQAQAVA